jgi:glutamine amidotransferase
MDLAIINCGIGNLTSVAHAFEVLGCTPVITRDPSDLAGAERIVLPGVGAFGDGIRNLRDGGWIGPLEDRVLGDGTPFLGICLGMQLLASEGTEDGPHRGLGWIPGMVRRIDTRDPLLRVPHIGWNDVFFKPESAMYRGMGASATFYFINSYTLHPDDTRIVTGTFQYGEELVASIEKDNIAATQYHPEKSQQAGLHALKNFLEGG